MVQLDMFARDPEVPSPAPEGCAVIAPPGDSTPRAPGERGRDAVAAVCRHAIEAIRNAYPELADECAEQIARRSL